MRISVKESLLWMKIFFIRCVTIRENLFFLWKSFYLWESLHKSLFFLWKSFFVTISSLWGLFFILWLWESFYMRSLVLLAFRIAYGHHSQKVGSKLRAGFSAEVHLNGVFTASHWFQRKESSSYRIQTLFTNRWAC